ncbi:hypothetical protein [Pseudomonas zhanjiangensis]|uniref:Uncharacterized protein n=1 Tax=Pseudomonas zhanjiangensis TaxID=3239015 RepID=A0ABV3YRB8_9PSED
MWAHHINQRLKPTFTVGFFVYDGAALSQGYQRALQALDKGRQPRPCNAQRPGLSCRDADCSLLGRLAGGAFDGIHRAPCFLDMTRNTPMTSPGRGSQACANGQQR